MLTPIAQSAWQYVDPNGYVWNASNAIVVPNSVWSSMNIEFNTVLTVVAIMVVIVIAGAFVVMMTPAMEMIKIRMSGGVGVISFSRTGRARIIPVKDKGGVLFSKEEIHQTLPGSMAIIKGCLIGACWDESGTCIPISHAAAMGMLARLGIPDAEVMELFNFYLMSQDTFEQTVQILKTPYDPNPPQQGDPNAEAKRLAQMSYQKAYFLELYPSAEPGAGSFGSLMQHAKEIYAVADEDAVVQRFHDLKMRIPSASTPEDLKRKDFKKYPYWWNTVRGLVCNVAGVTLSWVDIKNMQIYHQNPRGTANIVEDESDRKARKRGKDNSMMIVLLILGIMGIALAMVAVFKFM